MQYEYNSLPWLMFEESFLNELDKLDATTREVVRGVALKASDASLSRDVAAYLMDYGNDVRIYAREKGKHTFSTLDISADNARKLCAELQRALALTEGPPVVVEDVYANVRRS